MTYDKENASLVIDTQDELKEYLKKYNCKDLKSLEETLWFEYGICLRYHGKKII